MPNFTLLCISLQNLYKVLFHIDINRSVAGESAAALHVTGEGGYEIGVLDQLIDIADERPAGKMTACNIIDMNLLLLPGNSVKFRDQIRDAGKFKNVFDAVIIIYGAYERQKTVSRKVRIFLNYLQGNFVERNDYCSCCLLDGFCRNILNCPIDDILLLQAKQIPDTTADIALEHKNIPLYFQCGTGRKIRQPDFLYIIQTEVYWRTISL